ncbi:hypothetical protein OKJ48_14545 [Streptomyces kunmingensis]|uniref:Uncharacterized protein n=1 Tax=Streptomyces kunmingensis TaxID=68225 RepID=A0ABU6CBA3_9ACTN|nr:hypothetical protein [Streptomyces kunmingensis]MEB3961457.1 hypothetical protein [Streptomyces kunmingensis]
MPAVGETERAPNIAKAVWDAAGKRSRSEGLPLIWVASRALTDYAAGTLDLPRTDTIPTASDRRGRSVFATTTVWEAADKRRARDKIRSMSALVELLLDAYAQGEIHTLACMVPTAQHDSVSRPETLPEALMQRTGTASSTLSAA